MSLWRVDIMCGDLAISYNSEGRGRQRILPETKEGPVSVHRQEIHPQ